MNIFIPFFKKLVVVVSNRRIKTPESFRNPISLYIYIYTMKNMCKSLNLICFSYQVFQQKVLRLIDNRTKVVCSISEILFLDKGDPNLDFNILFFLNRFKIARVMRIKDRNALNRETSGSLEFYILMHEPRCTFC